MKKIKYLLFVALIIIPTIVFAEPPAKPPGEDSNVPGGNNGTSNITHTGATTFSSNTEESNKTYSSNNIEENALLVTNGTCTINNPKVIKEGSPTSRSDNYDFYGTNAAILVSNGTLNINGGTITSSASYANAVFAYKSGTINVSDTTINTTENNSGGVMVTGGGTLTANNCNVKTEGNSSAAIRSDRGGGTLIVNNGTYETNGVGSPVIYSTANITVNNANLTSNVSEAVVVEGKNSVSLNNADVTSTNTKLNGNSETYKSIFIYQSMSGDADVGTSSFTSKNSNIVNNKGDVIFVTNTNTVINLENNNITNNDSTGAFLKVTSAKWGTSGSNGGNVILNLTNQNIVGDIIIDDISTLDLTMKESSILTGSIDSQSQANSITLNISKDSVLSLTADTYLTSLTNEDNTNSNIYSNGKYKLYVNGKETSINETSYNASNKQSNTTDNITINNNVIIYIIGVITLLLVIGIVFIIINKKKNVTQMKKGSE